MSNVHSTRPERPVRGGQRRQWESPSDWARTQAAVILKPIAYLLDRIGVQPNTITLLGLLLQTGVGLLFYQGHVQWGGWLLLIFAPMDALDGALARIAGKESSFGAFLDSTLDRISDAALILGLAGHHLRSGADLEAALFLVALVAALMVSYTRARAEALGFDCQVGVLTRMERIGLIAILSGFGLLTSLAWSLAVLSVFTFLQRVLHVHARAQRQSA
jgi:CDP-diacylglycerol---glycerol-3-phosphate 3-phosphatidyltransferase